MELRHLPRHLWSRWPELNRRPTPYHGVALPAELHRHKEVAGPADPEL
ncbi:MAG: hypothetical protein UV57_C0023G0027 [Parcubacteria group bacterium GW2011_GWD2_43_10]|nr:MAG: hypothetical protein UV57_C0023G0027 [Parcubacteria group bacterium GW2011_GWD2_43_10]